MCDDIRWALRSNASTKGNKMKRTIATILLIISIAVIFAGCSGDKDKAAFLEWLHGINADNAEVHLWTIANFNEKLLSKDAVQSLADILANVTLNDITWNEDLAGGTPEYGLRLIIDNEVWYMNESISPLGQMEGSFRNKLWLIKSAELKDFIYSQLAQIIIDSTR